MSSSSSSSSSQPQKKQEQQSIQRQLAQRIISSQKPTATQPSPLLTTIAIAGGGSSAVSTLTSLPNASRILHDAHILYSRESIRQFLADGGDCDDDLKFVSPQMASSLSLSTLRHALASRRDGSTDGILGVGCTSALRSSSTDDGAEREGRRHPVHVRARTMWGEEWGYDAVLNPRDEREVQEDSVGYLILKVMMEGYDGRDGDGAEEREEEEERRFVSCRRVDRRDREERETVETAVGNVLNGDVPAVVLLERTRRDDDDDVDDDDEWGVMNPTYLPSGVVIVPGSFNPVHDGHVRLAEAAVARCDDGGGNNNVVLFELSLINADKPPLEKEEVLRRVDLIREVVKEKNKSWGNTTTNWGVLLTSKPLFVQKVNMLQQFVIGAAKRMNFVIGTDTMIRILDPKYYNDNYDEMIDAMKDIKNKGVHFIVGGRLQQIKDHGGGHKFINGEEELKSLPNDLQLMFTLLSEDDFRVDISSTELRKKKEIVKATSS